MSIGEILNTLPMPEKKFLPLHNGRNAMRGSGFNPGIEKERVPEAGNILTLSGPAPFNRGFRAILF
jgi:hypothetical protein